MFTPKMSMTNVLLLVASGLILLLILNSERAEAASILGFGGVYDSEEAQAYWTRRFGKSVLQAARAASKSAREDESRGSIKRPRTQSGKESVPKFVGTLSDPSPLYLTLSRSD